MENGKGTAADFLEGSAAGLEDLAKALRREMLR